MSETPKPPEGYESWIDYCLVWGIATADQRCAAEEELAYLRRCAAAWEWLASHPAECLLSYDEHRNVRWYTMTKETPLPVVGMFDTPLAAVEAAIKGAKDER